MHTSALIRSTRLPNKHICLRCKVVSTECRRRQVASREGENGSMLRALLQMTFVCNHRSIFPGCTYLLRLPLLVCVFNFQFQRSWFHLGSEQWFIIPECTLRSGIQYHSTLGDQFFLWRSKDYDSLEYTAFPSTYKNIFQVVEGEPLVNGLQNWVVVLTDARRKTFNWVNKILD